MKLWLSTFAVLISYNIMKIILLSEMLVKNVFSLLSLEDPELSFKEETSLLVPPTAILVNLSIPIFYKSVLLKSPSYRKSWAGC